MNGLRRPNLKPKASEAATRRLPLNLVRPLRWPSAVEGLVVGLRVE